MIEKTDEVLIEKITTALQKIQDNVVPGSKGLDRFEMKVHILYWELGLLLKEFVDCKSISSDNINEELENNFREIEKKIRSDGTRKGNKPFPSWEYKDQRTKKMREPGYTWILVTYDFVKYYQDLERWNLVADLSGAMFNDGFVRKRAEDLFTHFSKEDPPPHAKELQNKFVKEMSKFEKNPSREREFLPLIQQIFGKSKIDINLAKESFLRIKTDVHQVIDEKDGTTESRKEFSKSIGIDPINSLRRLLRLISITDKEKFEKRLNQVGKLSRTIKTKHSEAKDLYQILYSLIKDLDSKKKFYHRITPHELVMLNTKLLAITSEEAYQEYLENQKSREALFS